MKVFIFSNQHLRKREREKHEKQAIQQNDKLNIELIKIWVCKQKKEQEKKEREFFYYINVT